ncbi:MAG: competence/damage-inducible protein A [Alphaproteobacteria bacterium]|nr:competence/damage-inducible protein A [Alphaproteobacteria bacterium]MBV9418285.1 competence/damage-inducible protein A [Alphaproteobacteria bacterium]
MSQPEPNPTAAILVIGDEILSGRTQDTNTAYIAKFLGALGIDLREARVVPDVQQEIVDALNALRTRYTYVFTTGGIGPTHDDITFEAVAAAFGVGCYHHPEAIAAMAARYKPGEFNEARRRMAYIPVGAELVRNSVSTAPGVHIGNVFVMAGIPMVMRAMMDAIEPLLKRGGVVHSATVQTRVPEGRLAEGLSKIQRAHAALAIGSYPFYREEGPGVQLVARGRDAEEVETAAQEIEAMLRELGAESARIKTP